MLKDDPSDIRFPSLFTNKVTTSWKWPRGVVAVVISSTCLQYVIMHARGACRRTLFTVIWRINSFSGLRRSHDQFPLNSTALLSPCRICHVENKWERGHGQRAWEGIRVCYVISAAVFGRGCSIRIISIYLLNCGKRAEK